VPVSTTPAYADSDGNRAMQEFELNAAREALGEIHPKTILAKNNLGVTLRRIGCLPQARELLGSALSDCRRVWGKKHPHTIMAMNNLAVALNDLGDATKALPLLTTVVNWRTCTLGAEHPDTIAAMASLAITLGALNDHEAAHQLETKVLKLRLRELGENNLDTLEAMGNLGATINNIAVALRNDGNLKDAEPLQFQALAMVVKAYGDDDLITASVYSATGALLKRQGDVTHALVYFQKALEIREKKLGSDDKLTLLVRSRLSELLH
jgi:tetratricopeptide (TPR) repeat protein